MVATAERHATIDRALRLLGLGAGALEPVAAGPQGAIDVADLAGCWRRPAGPTIVFLQAGNVNTGAFDDLAARPRPRARRVAAVDGAFGLWAAARLDTRHLATRIEPADSWDVDGHK